MENLSKNNSSIVIDDTCMVYEKIYKTQKRSHKRTLEDDLSFLMFTKENEELELDPNSDLAKLELEMAKYGLKVTPDTDIKQLAATLKLLGLV